MRHGSGIWGTIVVLTLGLVAWGTVMAAIGRVLSEAFDKIPY